MVWIMAAISGGCYGLAAVEAAALSREMHFFDIPFVIRQASPMAVKLWRWDVKESI